MQSTIKEKIKQQFNQASSSYDRVGSIQFKSAQYLVENLIEHFNPKHINTILDLGTGTGYVSTLLMQNYPNSKFDLNDISPNMLKLAAQQLNTKVGNLILGDMEELNFAEYDLIISNFSLQWVENLGSMLIKLFAKTRFLAFSCLLLGTFNEWINKFDNLNYQFPICKYPEANNLQALITSLKPKKLWTAIKDYHINFNNPIEVMRYLKQLGASTTSNSMQFKVLKNLVKSNDPINLTYKVFFGILQKY